MEGRAAGMVMARVRVRARARVLVRVRVRVRVRIRITNLGRTDQEISEPKMKTDRKPKSRTARVDLAKICSSPFFSLFCEPIV